MALTMRTARANHNMLFPASAKKSISMARHLQVFTRRVFDFSAGRLPTCLAGKQIQSYVFHVCSFSTEVVLVLPIVFPYYHGIPMKIPGNIEKQSCILCQTFLTFQPGQPPSPGETSGTVRRRQRGQGESWWVFPAKHAGGSAHN